MSLDDLDLWMAAAAVLLLAAVAASKLSTRLGVPSLLLFLGIGMLAGSEGIGGVDFDNYEVARSVGVVALAFILFSGGFDTVWSDVRPQVPKGILLATVGVVITAGLTGLAGAHVLGVSLATGLLLGAIVSSTDATAVFSVMRSRGVGLRGGLRPLLELESGSNDPMAVFLTVAIIEYLVSDDTSWTGLLGMFANQLVVGVVFGVAFGVIAAKVVNRLHLEYDGLYPVLLIAIVLGVYGATALVGGSGFLAVYLAGVVMGNVRLVHRRSLNHFADGIAWLMQIVMFLVLGLLVFPSALRANAWPALAISAVLIVVARPISVMLLLGLSRTPVRESAFVSWVGLRGAVPIILATYPLAAGVEHGELLFNVVFFTVLTSVAIQGTTIPQIARRLRVDEAPIPAVRPVVELSDTFDGHVELHQVSVEAGAPAIDRQILELELADDALIVLVSRGPHHLIPQGSTRLLADDELTVLAGSDALSALAAQLRAGATDGGAS